MEESPFDGLGELGYGLAVLAGFVLFGVWLLRLVWRLIRVGLPPPLPKGMPGGFLDTVLYRWTPQDDLTLRGMLDGGILILGRPGSGKSSSSSYQLLKAAAAYPLSGGLILAASSGDLALCEKIFAGEKDRLIVFDERTHYRFNAISYILERGGSTKDILAAIYAIAESIGRSGGKAGGDEGSFFDTNARRVMENAIVIVKHATGGVKMFDLVTFINEAASSLAEFQSKAFEATTHHAYLQAAYEKEKSETEEYDVEQAGEFFAKELPRMADRTRTSVLAVVLNTLHVFNSGVNRQLFSTTTNISPKWMDMGAWIFVDQPISRCGVEGAFALGLWKFMAEWHVLRRDTNVDNPPCFIHADEMHRTVNAFDSLFLGECRKFGGCMIACTQSKASFYANMGGEAAEAKVDALLNNFTHKIIHALGDIKTASWASELVGSRMQLNMGGSEHTPESLFGALQGLGVWSGSINEQMRPIVEPKQFMHGLRTGGRHNGFLCDAVVIRSGEPFASNGENHLFLSFSQR
jgi:Type IV secretion-system coupling protein DNA-binding domain